MLQRCQRRRRRQIRTHIAPRHFDHADHTEILPINLVKERALPRLLLAHLVPARIIPPRPRRTLPHLVQHSQTRAAHARSAAPTSTAPHRVDTRLRRLHDTAILLGHQMKVATQRMRRM